MVKTVPLISSGHSGPLGVKHLPRLWQKGLLDVRGILAPGYDGVGGKGYDDMTLKALNLSEESVRKFLSTGPSYFAFEKWIRDQPGVVLDKEVITKHNAAVDAYHHADDTRSQILGTVGLPVNDSAPRDAVTLNNYEDWHEFYVSMAKSEV